MKSTTIQLCPPAGTSDYFPIDMKARNWLLDIWKKTSFEYGYLEYDSSIIENSSLYAYKGGDDILKEMYSFELGGAKLSVRPEMTPTLARMVLSVIQKEIIPIKWFSLSQCYRYENVSSCRKREFYQWNVDCIGGETIKEELEMFCIMVSFFKKVGLTSDNIEICVSHRMILQKVLKKMGVIDESKILSAFNIIDKLDKLTREELNRRFIEEVGLDEENIEQLYKLTTIKKVEELESFLDKDDDTLKEMIILFELAEKIGLDAWLKFDMSIVRGLSYYTHIVAECFFKNISVTRAVCGGGRYDNLLKSYGYKDTINSVGFGMGNIVMLLGLHELKLLPMFTIDIDYIIVPFNDEYYPCAFAVAEKIRDKGKSVELFQKKCKIKNAYDYANRKNAKYVVLLAPEEWKENMIVVKDMKTENREIKQMTVNLDEYINAL